MCPGRGFPCRQPSDLIFKSARSGGMRGDNRAARLRVAPLTPSGRDGGADLGDGQGSVPTFWVSRGRRRLSCVGASAAALPPAHAAAAQLGRYAQLKKGH